MFPLFKNNRVKIKMNDKIKYKRILLKISGEALAGEKGFGFDQEFIDKVVDQLVYLNKEGVEIGIVVGGGIFWRG